MKVSFIASGDSFITRHVVLIAVIQDLMRSVT